MVKRRTLNWIRRLACAGTLLSGLKLQVQLAVGEIADYQPITDPKVKELLKMVNIVGRTAVGSDEKKNYMLVELKSSMVYYGCPTIFLTINPGERHSPLALYYAGEEIDIKHFLPEFKGREGGVAKLLKLEGSIEIVASSNVG